MRLNKQASPVLQYVMSTALTRQLSWPEPQVKEPENEEVNMDFSAEGKHRQDGLAGVGETQQT